MIFALSQETKHPDLKVFFNIQFDCTGNPNTNIENISRFSCSYTLNLTANTYNEKKPRKNKSLFTDERSCKVKSLVDSIPSRFLKFTSRCWKEQLHTGLNVFRRFWVCHKVSQCTKQDLGHKQDLFLAQIWFSLPHL